jgi:hypothetical protein
MAVRQFEFTSAQLSHSIIPGQAVYSENDHRIDFIIIYHESDLHPRGIEVGRPIHCSTL